MKKFILLLVVMFTVGLAVTYAAQGAELPNDEITIGFTTISGVLLLVSAITEGFKKIIDLKGVWYQVFSWVIAISISLIGWYFKIGLFDSIQLWYYAVLAGIGFGLMSNGFYDFGMFILRYSGLNVNKKLSIKDQSNYFKNHSSGGTGEFRIVYDNGSALIHPLGKNGKTIDIKIK